MPFAPLQIPQANINSQADFSPLAGLGDIYKKAQNERKLSDLGKQLAAGTVDYRTAAGQLADMGDVGSTLKFLALAEQQRKEQLGQQASEGFTRILTPAQTIAPPPSAAVNPAPNLRPNAAADDEPEPTRVAAVTPTATPIRTNPNGTIAGNITAPTEPPPVAPAATATPSFDARFAAARPAGVTPAAPRPEFQLPPIPALLGALTNQYLPETQKEIAKDMLKRQFDALKPTDKIATLQALRDDPQLLAIEKDLRKSQATNVNLLPGEKAQDTEMGKTLGEIHSGYIKDALKVPANKANLDAAERAMTVPGFVSGTAQPAIVAAQRALGAIGLIGADKASPNELFQKLQNKAIMDAGGSASGLGPQISNNDARIIRDSTFNATNTPEGNRKIIGFQRLIEDRKVDYAREMARYAKAHGGRIDIDVTDHMAKWADANPLDFSKIPGLTRIEIDGSSAGGNSYKNVPFKVDQ